jgi:sugar O-acyltransferase (sialic acid O-acetyltransferase NeuD family)
MENKNLILVGGGGHCKSVIDVAESAGYTIKGILDLPEKLGEKILGYPIIGSDERISDFIHDFLFLVTLGHIKDASLRINLHQKILDVGGQLATIIATTAHVSKYATIGEGSVIMHHAVVNADAVIGKGCIINTFANIEHDVVVGDYCHISTGAMINGNCKIGRGTFIGSQSVIVNGVEVTEECVIGAGSTVRKDLKQKGIYSGNPALFGKILK